MVILRVRERERVRVKVSVRVRGVCASPEQNVFFERFDSW